MYAGQFYPKARDELKQMVREGTLRLMLGTDAASEGAQFATTGAFDQSRLTLESYEA